MYSSILEVGSRQDGLRAAAELISQNRPDLDPESMTYRAAVVLLIAPVIGCGVHKLAKVTGYPSEFVARCARRLVDNGVWPDGQPYCSGYTVYNWDDFWRDVGVAEGKLCRRCDETGELQWAAPGEWWKEYDFAVGTRNVSEGVIRYQPATIVPTSLLKDGMCDEDEVEEVEEERKVEFIPAPRRPLPRPGMASLARPKLVGAGNVVVLGGADLTDACWLS